MRSGEFFKETQDYVNIVCKAFIKPSDEWIDIECRHKGSDGICFIKLVDAAYDPHYIDITGMTLDRVFLTVAKSVSGERVEEELVQYDQRKEVARLFAR